MKTIELQTNFGLDNLVVTNRPEPQVGPGQIVLRMRAWSLNFRDLLVAKGLYNPKLQLPFVPLSDGVGEIVSVGPGVTQRTVGERVTPLFMPAWQDGDVTEAKSRSALGGGGAGLLAEYIALPEDGVVPVPNHLTDEEAATLPCAALTAWHALVALGQVKAGDSVLVQGTGGVSIFALQFAAIHGARVIVTSSSDAKLARARELGASDTINYRETPDWATRVRELTAGAGVDHVIEVGGAGTLPQSLKAVRMGGRVSLIGVLTGGGGQFNPVPVLMKNICLQGIYVGSRRMFEAMNRAIEQTRMRPVVDRVFGFPEAARALRLMEQGGHFGKIVLKPE